MTETKEPIEVIIGIPEELRREGREYYIICAHDGEYIFMEDKDDTPDTITISTELFSSYAIAYEETEDIKQSQSAENTKQKCGLCHICPTFLGICCFIWMAVIVAVIIIIIIVLRRKKDKDKEQVEK